MQRANRAECDEIARRHDPVESNLAPDQRVDRCLSGFGFELHATDQRIIDRNPGFLQRFRGYSEALQEAGVEIDDALIGRVEFEAESAESAVSGLLLRKTPFDGIVAASDLIALGAIRALHRAELTVPRDVSVVGYDNNLLSRLSTPTLSTVQQDIPKAGRMLVSKLLEWTGDARPEMLSTELIIRESCGA